MRCSLNVKRLIISTFRRRKPGVLSFWQFSSLGILPLSFSQNVDDFLVQQMHLLHRAAYVLILLVLSVRHLHSYLIHERSEFFHSLCQSPVANSEILVTSAYAYSCVFFIIPDCIEFEMFVMSFCYMKSLNNYVIIFI